MKLTTVHQVLIVGAIVLCSVFALRSVVMFTRGAAALELVWAALAGGLAAVGGVYLRRFRQKLQAGEASAKPVSAKSVSAKSVSAKSVSAQGEAR